MDIRYAYSIKKYYRFLEGILRTTTPHPQLGTQLTQFARDVNAHLKPRFRGRLNGGTDAVLIRRDLPKLKKLQKEWEQKHKEGRHEENQRNGSLDEDRKVTLGRYEGPSYIALQQRTED